MARRKKKEKKEKKPEKIKWLNSGQDRWLSVKGNATWNEQIAKNPSKISENSRL